MFAQAVSVLICFGALILLKEVRAMFLQVAWNYVTRPSIVTCAVFCRRLGGVGLHAGGKVV